MTIDKSTRVKSLYTKKEWNEILLKCTLDGDQKGVIEALDYGAEINTTNIHRESPLHIAVINGNVALTSILIGRGADLTRKDKSGRTAKDWAIENNHQRLSDLFERREQRLKSASDENNAAHSFMQKESDTKTTTPPEERTKEGNHLTIAPSRAEEKQAEPSSITKNIFSTVYNLGRHLYDSGIGGTIANAAFSASKYLYNNGYAGVITEALIRKRIYTFNRNVFIAKKAVHLGSYFLSKWLGTTSSETSPPKFVSNPSFPLAPDERGFSMNDSGIFYHVGDKRIPIRRSSDSSTGVSEAIYEKLLKQMEKLKKLDEIKSDILDRIQALREKNKSIAKEKQDEIIIEEIAKQTGIKLSFEDVRQPEKLEETLSKNLSELYLQKCVNEKKLYILEKIAALKKSYEFSSLSLDEKTLEEIIIKEIHKETGIEFIAEDLHNAEKFDQKIVDSVTKQEMSSELTQEERREFATFIDNQTPGLEQESTEIPKSLDANQKEKYNNMLLKAAKTEDIEFIKALIREGADINFQSELDGKTALHIIAENPYSRIEITDLIELGSDPTIKDKTGDLPLHFACKAGEIAPVYHLLAANLETINTQNSNGMTGLHLAAEMQDSTMLRAIFELIEDNEKVASESPEINKVELKINLQDSNGNSALHLATFSESTENVRLLYAKSADVNLVDNLGDTALHIALGSKRQEMQESSILLDLAPSDKLVLNLKDGEGNTILHQAAIFTCKHNDQSLYEKLCENGADPLAINDHGISPQQIILNHSLNLSRKTTHEQIEDGKTKRNIKDLLPACVALGSEVEMRKVLALKEMKESEYGRSLLIALDTKDRKKLEEIRKNALGIFVSSSDISAGAVAPYKQRSVELTHQ